MTFLNPLLLIALVAASIPLLLHLLNLRKLRTVEFSSIRFLKELQRSRMRRLRVRQILLLVLRTLLVVFAVLAFARPAFQGVAGLPGSHAATTAVILIDNSPSMDVVRGGETGLVRAKRVARQIVDMLEDDDDAWLLPMTGIPLKVGAEPTRSRELLRRAVDSLRSVYRCADLETSLRLATSLLDRSANLNKEVHILTDAQTSIIEKQSDSLRLLGADTRVYIHQLPSLERGESENLGIDSLVVLSSVFETGKPVEIRSWVHNYGPSDATDVVVSSRLNDEPGTQVGVNIASGGVAVVDLVVTPRRSGAQSGHVQLPRDVMDADNRRHFAFAINDRAKIAVLGSTEALAFLSVAFDVMKGAVEYRLIPPSSAGSIDLDETASLVIADATVPDVDRIARYVEQGGGLVIFGGPGTNPIAFNAGLGMRLGIALAPPVTPSSGSEGGTGISWVEREHPLFAGVFDPVRSGTSYESPNVRQLLPTNGGTPVIRLVGDRSLVTEFRKGKGRVLYVAVPPSTVWSDLPKTGLFLPLAVRSALYVAARGDAYPSIEIGESVTIPLSDRGALLTQVTVTQPDGLEEIVGVRKGPGGTSVMYDRAYSPGSYVVSHAGTTHSLFTANVESSESALESLSRDEFTARVASHMVVPANLRVLEGEAFLARTAIVDSRVGLELWKYALMLAVACALAEVIVARTATPN